MLESELVYKTAGVGSRSRFFKTSGVGVRSRNPKKSSDSTTLETINYFLYKSYLKLCYVSASVSNKTCSYYLHLALYIIIFSRAVGNPSLCLHHSIG